MHAVHDLPHLVVESLFGIGDGLWGELVSGRHGATDRAATARDPKRRKWGRIAAGEPGQPTEEWLSDRHRYAKAVTNAVANPFGDGPDTPEGVRARLTAAGVTLAGDVDDETIAFAITAVGTMLQRWADTPPGEPLRVLWPTPPELL